jgi:hypothetical protein
MKKSILLLVLVFLISGCTLHNAWIVKGDGKDLKGPYQVANAEANKVDVIFTRTLLFTTQKVNKEFLESLPSVKVVVDKDSNIKSAEIGGQQK